MTYHFSRIALYARQHRADRGVEDTLKTLKKLLQQLKLEVFLEQETADFFQAISLPSIEISDLKDSGDLIIVVGGDGSMLSAARAAVGVNAPVLGINRGNLGFLTDISPDEVDGKLQHVLEGKYIEEPRFLFNADIRDDNKILHSEIALNDVVLTPGDHPYLIEFEILIDQKPVCHQRADGIIVTTPTGSTAYALSAGGPILHPKLNAIALVPMLPHTLSSRPIVVDGNSEICLNISVSNEASPRVSYDGQKRFDIAPGQQLHIRKQAQRLRLIHPLDYHYYQTLRSKLGWES